MPTYAVTEYITEHPRVPGLKLRAAQDLRPGEMCMIDEDGQVYRTPPPYRYIDGVASQAYAVGQDVCLLKAAYTVQVPYAHL